MSQARLLAVTEEIYDAATGGTPWAVVGARLKDLIRAESFSLMAGDVLAGTPEVLCQSDFPDSAIAAYRRHYRHVDLWTKRAAAIFARDSATGAPPRASVSGTFVPDAEFVESEFYRDFGRHHGLRYVVGTVVPLGEAGAMPIGLHRPEGAERFGEEEKRLLETVLPHLRRAVQLRHRLGLSAPEAPAPGLAALDALAMPMLILDADLHVLVANLAAEALAARSGGPLRLARVTDGRGGPARTMAAAAHRDDRAALLSLVRATALGGGAGGAVRLRDADGIPTLAALVTPLPSRLAGATGGLGRVEGRALVLLREIATAPRAPSADLLRRLFGLTRAEAEVARALAGGATKASVAAARGLRETTVRTHVRAVLDKTGTANLRELERMLAGFDGM